MTKSMLLTRRHWPTIIAAAVLVLTFAHLAIGLRTQPEANTQYSLRHSNYPNAFISMIHLDLTSPGQVVRLTWSGPGSEKCETGPFPSSPGKGLGSNDCNDVAESNRSGSNCTPKGTMLVEGLDDSLPSSDSCKFVTWFNMCRSVAFHSHSKVPAYPVSHGCVRLSEHAAQLIHDNVIVGKTSVVVDGTWTRPQAELDRGKLLRQLRRHEGKSNKVYADSLGIPTIGIGFNLKRSRAQELIANLGADYAKILSGTEQLDDRQVNELFNADIEESIENCKSMFPNFSQLSDVRQRVLVDMMFNLGPDRLGAFKNLRAALEQLDFDQAANEMEHSVWYRQVKLRGKTLAAMMRTDADP